MKQRIDPASLEESLGAFIEGFLRESPDMPLVEFATFSGLATDFKVDTVTSAVFLRLRRDMALDGEGKPHELWARLAAPSGLWVIPRVETEVLVLAPALAASSPGGAWCFLTAQSPRAKVSQSKAYLDLDDETELAASAMAYTLRAVCGSFFSISAEGQITLGALDGSHIAIDPVAHKIQVVVTDGATPSPKVIAAITLDSDGIKHFVDGSHKAIQHLDASTGGWKTIGSGQFLAGHPGGCLGPVATSFVGLPGGAASISWKIGG